MSVTISSDGTITNTVNSTANMANAASAASSTSTNGLGENAYLKILATELQYQDPTAPTDETATIAQMAQFSALQATTNLNTTLTDYLSSEKTVLDTLQSNSITAQAASIMGKSVTATVDNATISGTVTGFTISNGSITMTVGDKSVPLADIYQVAQA